MNKKFKVIAVDDKDDILSVYHLYYDESPYELITFNNVCESIEFIKNNHKEIVYVMSDYSMPEKNGFSFKKELNDLAIDIPFIIVTAYYDKDMATEGMSLGVSYFIEKPVLNITFPEAILDLIDRRINILNEELTMITSFIEESAPMLDEIEELILKLENDPENESILNTYYRLLHTIKGTAACVGITNIPQYVHAYENLIGRLKNKEIAVNQEIINIMLIGLDGVKNLYQDAKNGKISNDVKDLCHVFAYNDEIQLLDQSNIILSKEKTETTKDKVEAVQKQIKDSQNNKLTVDIDILDTFMESSGELTVLRNTILKSAMLLNEKLHGDKDLAILSDALVEMHKVSSSLQNDISEMRKISVDSIFRPLKRVVRDSSKVLSKEIIFNTSGDDLKIDTSIGKVLSNALVHMIRNSIDHGIEKTDARINAGKDSKGKIELSLREDGENIIVSLKDDGNGLNINRIKSKAIEQGLYTEEQIKHLSEQKIFSIIFESGFSTAQAVTDISGRGVGMDMVRSSVESVGGKIIINSSYGVGTQFTIVLPIPRSVLIIKSLMVLIDKGMYSIPLDEVKEVVKINNDNSITMLQRIRNSHFLKHHEELIPIIIIRNYFNNTEIIDEQSIEKIVIVKADGHRFGVVVDDIFDIEEIVVKKLSTELRSNKYFKGVTFVGNGDLALILDLNGIAITSDIKAENNDLEERYLTKLEKNDIKFEEFMQFNLQSKKNFAIPLDSVKRLEFLEVKDIEYTGDVPIIQYRGSVLPLILTEKNLGFINNLTTIETIYPEIIKVIVAQVNNKIYGLIVDEICDIGMTSEIINENLSDREQLLGTIFLKDITVSVVNLKNIIQINCMQKHDEELEKMAA